MTRPASRSCPTRNGNYDRVASTRRIYMSANEISDMHFNDEELRQKTQRKEQKKLVAESVAYQQLAADLQKKLNAALKYADTLLKQLNREKTKADSILEAWESVTDMSFAVEARYGIGLTVEQFNSIGNSIACYFDDDRNRWMQRTIPGTGNSDINPMSEPVFTNVSVIYKFCSNQVPQATRHQSCQQIRIHHCRCQRIAEHTWIRWSYARCRPVHATGDRRCSLAGSTRASAPPNHW